MDHFLLFMFRVCLVFLSVLCSIVVTCWARANLLVQDVFMCSSPFSLWCPRSGVVLDCIDS